MLIKDESKELLTGDKFYFYRKYPQFCKYV